MGTSVSLDTLKVKHFKVLKVLKKVVSNLKMAGDFQPATPKSKPNARAFGFDTSIGRPARIKFISRFYAISKKIPSLDAQRAGNLRAPFGFFSFLEKKMSVVKLKRSENPFEILPRATLQDARLSLDALGALVRLASLPGDWEWQIWHLEKEVLRIGRDARRRIFNELESAGYLTRSRQHNNKSGRWQHEYNLVLECSTSAASAGDGLAVAGETVDGQGGDKQNRKIENTQLENTQQQPEPATQSSGGGSLIFPSFLNKDVLQKIEDLARDLDQAFAQQILDVMAARQDVKNPIAFFKKLASDPASFDPTAGLKIAGARLKKKEVAAAKIASSELIPDVAAAAKGAAILAAAATRRTAK